MEPTRVRVIATALIEHPGGLVLLRRARNFGELDQGRGLWEPPGGTVEPDETTEGALRREVQEETSLQLPGDAKLVAVINYMLESGGKSVHRFHVLYALRLDHAPQMTLGEEHDSVRHVRTPSDLDSLEMIDSIREFLRGWLATRRAA